MILQGEETGLFFHITDDLRSEEKRLLQEKIDLLMDYLVYLKTFFDLRHSQKELDLRGIVKATALYLSVNLEGSMSARLKGYGDVAPGLEELLDPKLKEMISLLGEMEAIG